MNKSLILGTLLMSSLVFNGCNENISNEERESSNFNFININYQCSKESAYNKPYITRNRFIQINKKLNFQEVVDIIWDKVSTDKDCIENFGKDYRKVIISTSKLN